MTAREETLRRELARLTALRDRNEAKRWDPATPARSRFTYAAHVTKLNGRIARVERDLAIYSPSIPTSEVPDVR